MASSDDAVLILGIGNVLWADEGFGVRCAEALSAGWALPDNVTVMDGGTQGLYLLPYVTAARHLIVFDAVDFGLVPGTLHLVEGEDVPQFMGAKKMSLHQTGFQEVLASARLLDQLPETLLLIGVQPVELDDYGGSLRPEVDAQVTPAVSVALARLRDWGMPLVAREAGAERLNDGALSRGVYEGERPPEALACRFGDQRFFPEDA
ncbi:MAG: HyaD/HybD family hydrogenase maturation endopeptidase [Proteobacteria bacterium]|nr:MAG: HyaD/HybD family hydrogenase maturation endopeptidase [Pseudomonadota bacterium]